MTATSNGDTPQTASASSRIESIDAVRGFAVLGIFAMNIVSMAMPGYAYIDPYYYGGTTGADLLAWAVAYALADGKMRMLFSMLFGASLAIVADGRSGRSPGPAITHYRRLAILFGFGMIHAWLFWYGDILVEYAIAGSLVFIAWRWPTSRLLAAATLLIGFTVAQDLIDWHALTALRDAASGPHPPARAIAAWSAIRDYAAPPADVIATELRLYRGGFLDALAARAPMTRLFQTRLIWASMTDTMGFMLAGLALYRSGFLAGRWQTRRYAALIAIGYLVALPLYLPLIRLLLSTRFDPAILPLTGAFSLLLRPWVGLAHAGVVILLVRSGGVRWLTDRLAAAGRMALTNYLGTTLLATTIFNGYGLGLFGRLERAELYWIVLGVWVAILLWSKPWLARFHHGPLEWLWRRVASGKLRPFRTNSLLRPTSSSASFRFGEPD